VFPLSGDWTLFQFQFRVSLHTKNLPHPLQAVKYYTVMDMNPDSHFRIPETGVFNFEYKKLKQKIT
jgi:hypothetical protein